MTQGFATGEGSDRLLENTYELVWDFLVEGKRRRGDYLTYFATNVGPLRGRDCGLISATNVGPIFKKVKTSAVSESAKNL